MAGGGGDPEPARPGPSEAVSTIACVIFRRLLRLSVRAMVILFLIGAAYLLITFVQVVWASGRESHRPAQAIIVLGAAQYDGRPSPVLQGRLSHAVELYEQGVARVIVVTGGKKPGDRFTEAAAGYEYLRAHDVPESAILREENGGNTWEQLAAATRFLRKRHIDDVVLVSDDYHAYRLDRIAHELGLRAQVSPVDPGLSFGGEVKAYGRETAAVALGRIIGFRRLVNLDGSLSGVRSLGPVG